MLLWDQEIEQVVVERSDAYLHSADHCRTQHDTGN